MNWFQLANLNSIFDQAGEADTLSTLRQIKDMTLQTQRGARGMILDLRKSYEKDQDICDLFDKASFYCPDSPNKVKTIIDSVIDLMAGNFVKKKREEMSNADNNTVILKGLVS